MVLPANALFAGTLAWSCSTKVAAVETIFFRKKIQELPVHRILFAHDSSSEVFRDGRLVRGLVDDLRNGRVNMRHHPDMVLECCTIRSTCTIYSLNNRRLKAFQEYQKLCRERDVSAKCKLGCSFETPRPPVQFHDAMQRYHYGPPPATDFR